MKKLLSTIFIAALGAAIALPDENVRISGKWQMTAQSPHGPVQGPLEIKQEGAKFTGTYEAQPFGAMRVSGKVDGKNVQFTVEVNGGEATITFTGTVDGNKMSGTMDPHGGAWSATRDTGPIAKHVLGTVTEFKIASLEIGVRPDHTAIPVLLKFGPETQVLQVPPGDHSLEGAQPASITDIARGDRVMVSFVSGMTEARRIVLVSSDEIARRNEAARADWQARGISGIVASIAANQVDLEQRTPQGTHTITIDLGPKTVIRRYAPDSVKFADARLSTVAEIARGDQLQARGAKSEDGARIAAEEVVFGTFLTRIGTVTAIRSDGGQIEIQDLATKQPLRIRVTADSRLKKMPDMREAFAAMMSGHAHEPADPRAEIAKTIERLPPATIDDLKVGSAIVVTSTRGTKPDELTAITILANADVLVQMAAAHAGPNENPMDTIGRLHGGVLNGPNGVSLPAIIQ